jgi:hypothetical protein
MIFTYSVTMLGFSKGTTMYEYLAQEKQSQARVMQPSEAPGLADMMRAEVPMEGEAYGEMFVVVFDPGNPGVTSHRHEEWVVLYYVEPADTPIIVEMEEIFPEKDTMLVVPPNTEHSVPHNSSDKKRISIALKVPVVKEQSE